MNILLKIIAICLLLAVTEMALCQSGFAFQTLSKKDGLSQASVFAIAQDGAGFLWFGTRDGLNKYDGYQFKIYKTETVGETLAGNDVRTLYYDQVRNVIWVGTTTGLSIYDPSRDRFSKYSHDPEDQKTISNNEIRQIYRDHSQRLWVGTSTGLNLLDERTGEFSRYYIDHSEALDRSTNDVKVIHEDKQGTLWLGTADGLYRLRIDSNGSYIFEEETFEEGQQLSDRSIKHIVEDAAGNLWIGTFAGGLNLWNRTSGIITPYIYDKNDPTSLSHNNIRSLCLDENDNLWIGTFDGLNLLKRAASSFMRFSKSESGGIGLSDKSVRSLLIDDRGSLWVGTYYGGVNNLDEKYNRFKKNIPPGSGLRDKVVSSFAEDPDHNLWIGTEGDGINYFNKSKLTIQNLRHDPLNQNSLSGNNVKQLLLDGDYLWIGTFQAGLNRYDTKNGTFKRYQTSTTNKNTISANSVYGLLKDDNLLYILTYGGGLDILDTETSQFYHFKHDPDLDNTLTSDYGRAIIKPNKNLLWIGTESGLHKVTLDDSGLPVTFEVFLEDENIYSLTTDSNGYLWIGTFGHGFYHLDSQRTVLQHFNRRDGLPGSTVLGILEVAADELWISTNNGLSRFDPLTRHFTNYGYSNGLENSEYNYNAYLKDSHGDLLFGGFNGFTYFDPKDINTNTYVPPVVFTELRKNNQLVNAGDDSGLLEYSINQTNEITFAYREANFSIKFAALDYFSPENNLYTFMLEGIDNDWNQSVGKTEATYTIQKHGEYVFKLRGANSEGVWNKNERRLKIIVLPPLWKTGWAYLIYFILLLALALALYRFVKLQHRLQLEKLVNHQQAELHEVKLRFFTDITHEFRTPLTLILAPLKELLATPDLTENTRDKLDTAERNAQRMLRLVNQILTFRKLATDHTQLQIAKVNLVDFLQEIYHLFTESARRHEIDYHFETSQPIINVWIDQDKMEKVFFNLLSNAFKFTPDGGMISIRILLKKAMVVVRVSDTGIGIAPELKDQIFKRFYEKTKDIHSSIKGSGIGLAISKQMVELHQGSIILADSRDRRQNTGSTFIVQIRKGKQHFNEAAKLPSTAKATPDIDYTPLRRAEHDSDPNDLSVHPRALPPDAQTILIVEDNTELRRYLKSIFAQTYRTKTAKNGVEGSEKALQLLPDLIISDVMMPLKDGISLCKELKSTMETSDIPFILLTARSASLFKVEGLRAGADDYLTKPFDPEELKLRAQNLLQSRQKAKHKLNRLAKLDPEKVSISSADEVFLEKALQIVEKHLDQYDFNISQFAAELAVSRPQLFSKLKALTQQTPNNFIKSTRMKRAAQLLSTSSLNISEVAYKVGFRDMKYFSKCFKSHYGVPPSKYEAPITDA